MSPSILLPCLFLQGGGVLVLELWLICNYGGLGGFWTVYLPPLRWFISVTSVLIKSRFFKYHRSDQTSYLYNTFWYREGSMHWAEISFTKLVANSFPLWAYSYVRLVSLQLRTAWAYSYVRRELTATYSYVQPVSLQRRKARAFTYVQLVSLQQCKARAFTYIQLVSLQRCKARAYSYVRTMYSLWSYSDVNCGLSATYKLRTAPNSNIICVLNSK